MEQVRSRAGAHDVVDADVPPNTLMLAEEAVTPPPPAARVRSYEELDGATGRAVFFRPERLTTSDLAPLRGTVHVAFDHEHRDCALRDVSQSGVALLLVEQNAHKALQIAYHAYVLETGEVVMEGTGKELLASPEVRKAYLGE
jgi:hypothetical protein